MGDIQRNRKSGGGGGIGLLGGGVDDAVARALGQVQGMFDALEGRVLALEDAPAAEIVEDSGPGFDAEDIERRIRELEDKNRRLMILVTRLQWEFPVHRLAQVVSRETTYMVCVWYFPVPDTTGAVFYVAYPAGTDQTSYEDDQIVTVVPMRTDVVDPNGAYIGWAENSGGGGGGFAFYTAETYAALSVIVPEPAGEPALGYVYSTGAYYAYSGQWISFTHWQDLG